MESSNCPTVTGEHDNDSQMAANSMLIDHRRCLYGRFGETGWINLILMSHPFIRRLPSKYRGVLSTTYFQWCVTSYFCGEAKCPICLSYSEFILQCGKKHMKFQVTSIEIGMHDGLIRGTFNDISNSCECHLRESNLDGKFGSVPNPCIMLAWKFLGDHNLTSTGSLFYLCTSIAFLGQLRYFWEHLSVGAGVQYGENGSPVSASMIKLLRFAAYIKGFVFLPIHGADGQRDEEEKRFYLIGGDDIEPYIPSLLLCTRFVVTFLWYIVDTIDVEGLQRNTPGRWVACRLVKRLPQREFSDLFHSLAGGQTTEDKLDQQMCDIICRTFDVLTNSEARQHPCYVLFYKPAIEILQRGVPQSFLVPLSEKKTHSVTCKHRSTQTNSGANHPNYDSRRTCTYCVKEVQRVLVASIAELDKLNYLATHIHKYSHEFIDLLEATWKPGYDWKQSVILLSAVFNLLLFRLDRLVDALSWYVLLFYIDIIWDRPAFDCFLQMDNEIFAITKLGANDEPCTNCTKIPTSVAIYLQRTLTIWYREVRRQLGMYRHRLDQCHEDVAKLVNRQI